jgi:hypothetical protein
MHRSVNDGCPTCGDPLVDPPTDVTYTPLPGNVPFQPTMVCMKCRIGYIAKPEGWLAIKSF